MPKDDRSSQAAQPSVSAAADGCEAGATLRLRRRKPGFGPGPESMVDRRLRVPPREVCDGTSMVLSLLDSGRRVWDVRSGSTSSSTSVAAPARGCIILLPRLIMFEKPDATVDVAA